ncbi:MAG: hypothetical protein DRG73_08975 [Deltaproteobacteria bacterium]|nr:MAG: hypothetical protein DRG73_08975 [Deltaproteobacteria bacterium]
MQKVKRNKVLMEVVLHVLVFIFISGCATQSLSEKTTPLGESQQSKETEEASISLYYDFKDVPVPKKLKLQKEKSFVFQTTEFTTGILTFSGKIESDSLISYFINKMPDDGWRFLSSFKSPKNILFFQKESRFCIITIISRAFSTNLEILITPRFRSGFKGM